MPSHLRAGTPLAYLFAGLAILAGVLFLATPTPGPVMIVVLVKLLTAAWPAALYLAGAVGLGRAFRPVYAGVRDEPLVQAGVGLAVMLTVSHLLGQAGVVRGAAGLVGAWAPVAAGLGLLGWQVSKTLRAGVGARDGEDRPWGMLDWAPVMVAAAVLVVASCNPPGGLTGLDYGGLWSSEFGGFDALSYHLPLLQEWLAAGRLTPVPHNVYSFLPGYMEAAFLHVSVLSGAGSAAGGLLADEGWRLLTCQMLHAGFAGVTAFGCVRLVRAWGPGDAAAGAGVGERLAACLAVATPWTVVVGSLAYNELAVTALSAPLLLVAADDRLAGWRRGVLAGLLLGAAASVKPPAAFLLGVPAAVFLFWRAGPKAWLGVVGGGVVAGVLVMAPWLVRNWLACGNPVFPEAHRLFGPGGWTESQFERYGAAHHESASLWAKVLMMFVRPAGSSQHRGLLHPQWALFFPAVAVLGVLVVRGRGVDAGVRRVAVRLGVGLVGAVASWLVLTHVQSRFLVPLLVPGAVLAGLGVLALPAGVRRGAAVVLGLGQALALLVVFAVQYGGQPGAALAWMPADAAGESYGRALKNAGSAERIEFFTKRATPQEYINLGLPPGSVVYLLGDATPLYCTGKVVYNTVWDRWPILEAVEADPGLVETQAGLWLAGLRKRGVTHVLLNIPEVARYRSSGYSDPRLTVEFVASVFIGRARVERQWPADRSVSPTHILFSLSGPSTGLARGER